MVDVFKASLPNDLLKDSFSDLDKSEMNHLDESSLRDSELKQSSEEFPILKSQGFSGTEATPSTEREEMELESSECGDMSGRIDVLTKSII